MPRAVCLLLSGPVVVRVAASEYVVGVRTVPGLTLDVLLPGIEPGTVLLSTGYHRYHWVPGLAPGGSLLPCRWHDRRLDPADLPAALCASAVELSGQALSDGDLSSVLAGLRELEEALSVMGA